MAKRLILVLVLLFVAACGRQRAATVKVRVEGKTQTLFAPQEVTVTAANALDALEQASLLGEFYYHVTTTSFGPYVDQVGRYGGTGVERLGLQGRRQVSRRSAPIRCSSPTAITCSGTTPTSARPAVLRRSR